MLRASLIVALAALGLAACVPCDSTFTDTALAPRPDFDPEIDACITHHTCVLLCRDLFHLDASIQIDRCSITLVEPAAAHVTVEYYDPNACLPDDGVDVSVDDWSDGGGDSTDDGSSDGSDDGSTDDGSGSDGSTDDGSTGDGGDTGDGTSRLAPERQHAHRDATVAR